MANATTSPKNLSGCSRDDGFSSQRQSIAKGVTNAGIFVSLDPFGGDNVSRSAEFEQSPLVVQAGELLASGNQGTFSIRDRRRDGNFEFRGGDTVEGGGKRNPLLGLDYRGTVSNSASMKKTIPAADVRSHAGSSI